MNRKLAAAAVAVPLAALGACEAQPSPSEPPTTSTPQTPAGPVPREFGCNPGSVTSDTPIASISANEALVLRPTGAPCENDLLATSAAGEQKLSLVPGMIALAHGATSGATTVACFSNEKHSQVIGGSALDRYSDGVAIECAARGPNGWTPTIAAVPSASDYAAWIDDVRFDGARIIVRWMRDSKFQFLHLDEANRPPTDGLYESELALEAGALVVRDTRKLDVPMFEMVLPPGP
jgi:hypothetical protein